MSQSKRSAGAWVRALHWPSAVFGMILTIGLSLAINEATALDIGGLGDVGKNITAAAKSLVNLKKNLETDVGNLTGNAKTLFSDKDNLVKVKDQLLTLATQTRSQIDAITKLISEVEEHIKTTQTNIKSTADHVGEIDKIKNSLTGGK